MKIIILIVCSILIILSWNTLSAQDGKYKVDATIDRSLDGQRAILYQMDNYNKVIRTDTSIIANGQFLFEGKEYTDALSSIIIKDKYGVQMHPIAWLMLEAGNIHVSYTSDPPPVSGTPLNDLFDKHRDSIYFFNYQMDKIDPEWSKHTEFLTPNTELGEIFYKSSEYYMGFLRQNFSNPLGKTLFISNLDIGNYTITVYVSRNWNWNKETLYGIFDFVDEETRKHPHFISYMNVFKKALETPTFINKQMGNYSFTTINGNTKKLSEYIGGKDYVFIEFWASWCGPCIATIPELKDIYKQYSDKLEIVSISLDTNNSSWKSAVKKQNMPWTQLADHNGFDSDIAKELGINGIPFGLLLDKTGVVIYEMTAYSLNQFMKDITKTP